ncbi:MAG TPA: helicase SNF2 [Campylobacterales bacterium]|nr:helicase SNF2 [Campylobacterales bacterium]
METFSLSIADISNNSDPKYFERGFAYFKKQAVIKLDFKRYDAKTMAIRSEVEGSSENIYHQSIFINVRESGMVDIDGDCSCPVGFNCKHIVAVLLQYIENEKNRYSPSQKRGVQWLKDFSKLSSTEEHVQYPEFLLYRLFEQGTYKIQELNFYRAKTLKKGAVSKGTRLRNLLHETYKHDFVDSDDLSIIQLLKALVNTTWSEEVTLEGEVGLMVLKKMVKSGRCYYRDAIEPLTFCKEILNVEFFWEEVETQKRKIVSNLNPEGTFILTSPPMYIDPIKNTLQVVHSKFDATSIDLLLQAPVVEVEDINQFMNKAFEIIPDVDIPIPQEFDYHERIIPLVPLLELNCGKDEEGRIAHYMRLSFLYEEHQLPLFPQKDFFRFQEQNCTVQILRDTEKEKEALEAIQAYGFELNSPNGEALFFSFAVPDMQTAIERWRVFLQEGISKLEKSSWIIEVDEKFNFQFEHSKDFVIQSEESETNGWFDLSYEVTIAGTQISLLPLITSLLREYNSVEELPNKLNLQLEDARYLHIDADEIKPILRTIFELYDHIDEDRIKIQPHDAHLVSGFEDNNIEWKGSQELAELSSKLRSFEGISEVKPSKNLTATLREYQQFGLNWINFLHEFHFSGILADDMGLGKTLQTLSFLQKQKELGLLTKPTLIIMPTSLIGNWKNEVKKFTNTLSVLPLYGADRAQLFAKIKEFDLILSTYQLALRDKEKFDKEQFGYIILDEAQKIKNPKAKMTLAIKSFKSKHRLALSGTPMENHLGELWSIFDFLMPGFLGTLSFFKKQYQTPIEKENDFLVQEKLKRKIAPFMLQRTKDEVLDELPEKIEIVQKVTFGKKQALLYENVRLTMEQKVRDAVADKGLSRSHITILDALLKLRQICCDPSLLSISEAAKVKESAKLETLFELVEELLSEGRKILVFSQFTSMLKIIQESLDEKNINYALLTGQTRKRDEVIEKFKKPDCNIFLISLKAGGVGLNLVEADTVIHYDPWWNPAVENQATDRAHRIGQTKTVFVYKLVVENSIEEKIVKLQEKKKSLQDGMYDTNKEETEKFDAEDLIDLLNA